jgi:ABC-2 type transport system permease protein
MIAIFKREFKAYFSTPIGYIFLAAFYFFLGIFFFTLFSNGSPAISKILSSMSTVIFFLLPVITMRTMSEDKRQKIDQILLTSPVKLSSIVLGKFFAALAVFAIGFAPTLIFEIIFAAFVSVNIFSYLYSLLGIMLLGGTLIAIGIFISSLTESTVVSAIITFLINIVLILITLFTSIIQNETIVKIISAISFTNVFQSFSDTIFSIADIIYFLSFIAAFLFLSVRSLEKRRWS